MSSSTTETWEALPPRQRKARGRRGKQCEDAIENEITPSIEEMEVENHAAAEARQARENKGTLNRERVEQNIEDRKRIKRAEATLQGKDGCAREYYEYLDHTADVQFHVWGSDLKQAFEHMAECMFNFITDIDSIDENTEETIDLEVKAHDMYALLFNYMDEILFRFASDGFCPCRAHIISFDRENFEIRAKLFGEQFSQSKHPQGTEIKAITYSNMQIHEIEGRADLYVIVDI